ncbi:unnamed protein product [Chondrus crispus]|uniref:Uncharacterized protein n=1 Tax=Chondrus crispus TaxID=2769 RepID=R7QJS7_CHOCR|nr:unnamed protein product [Chondrus crispus]CDF37665.1 unnamed protein product [Chondrus crispus]|eukprot:XP_005717536.1 unnamed protein product [Chondrus crispus]
MGGALGGGCGAEVDGGMDVIHTGAKISACFGQICCRSRRAVEVDRKCSQSNMPTVAKF